MSILDHLILNIIFLTQFNIHLIKEVLKIFTIIITQTKTIYVPKIKLETISTFLSKIYSAKYQKLLRHLNNLLNLNIKVLKLNSQMPPLNYPVYQLVLKLTLIVSILIIIFKNINLSFRLIRNDSQNHRKTYILIMIGSKIIIKRNATFIMDSDKKLLIIKNK